MQTVVTGQRLRQRRKTAKRPTKTPRFIAVHVVIEGLEFGPEGPAVRAELNAKAPYAYTGETRLGAIWARLTPETQAAIEAAWQRENNGAPLRAR